MSLNQIENEEPQVEPGHVPTRAREGVTKATASPPKPWALPLLAAMVLASLGWSFAWGPFRAVSSAPIRESAAELDFTSIDYEAGSGYANAVRQLQTALPEAAVVDARTTRSVSEFLNVVTQRHQAVLALRDSVFATRASALKAAPWPMRRETQKLLDGLDKAHGDYQRLLAASQQNASDESAREAGTWPAPAAASDAWAAYRRSLRDCDGPLSELAQGLHDFGESGDAGPGW